MSVSRRTLLFVVLGLVVWASVGTLTAAYYYNQYVETRRTFEEFKSVVIDVNVLMNYGNGTQNWHNQTLIAGATAFDALLSVTKDVDYRIFSFGVLVESINGVRNTGTMSGYAWFWYDWNATTLSWVNLQEAADGYILKPIDSIEWRYQSFSF